MGFVVIYSLATNSLNGVEITFGFGFAALGLVISFLVKHISHPRFYTDPLSSHGATVEAELGAH